MIHIPNLNKILVYISYKQDFYYHHNMLCILHLNQMIYHCTFCNYYFQGQKKGFSKNYSLLVDLVRGCYLCINYNQVQLYYSQHNNQHYVHINYIHILSRYSKLKHLRLSSARIKQFLKIYLKNIYHISKYLQ